ncbi:MAG: hypothetical protein GWN01_13540 [Nitrosopumilaceae archaeon]|nr:hypothetical protein [Nitrosopumilaceae archaeon]NIU88291.1 hypothetical protein [Nitrosopumilaceae archaeon]NIV66583.1 hypothetical protein [Nitrosopumilaceae archaeon]NIX62488.1 hypothetical protein [Nitrosopumilaceae archaeon]
MKTFSCLGIGIYNEKDFVNHKIKFNPRLFNFKNYNKKKFIEIDYDLMNAKFAG